MTTFVKALGQQAHVSTTVETGLYAPVMVEGGFLGGAEQSFSIGSAATGSAVAMVDLGKPYAFILVRCEDTDGIDASTTMTAQVAYVSTDTACDLWEQNAAQKWTSGTLPAADNGTFAFLLTNAFGFRHIRFVLSKNSTAAVVIKVRGLDGVTG